MRYRLQQEGQSAARGQHPAAPRSVECQASRPLHKRQSLSQRWQPGPEVDGRRRRTNRLAGHSEQLPASAKR